MIGPPARLSLYVAVVLWQSMAVIAPGGFTGATDRDCQEEGWHSH